MPPRYSREITLPIVMGDSLREQFRTSPCEHFCPAGNSIQKMQALVEKGEFAEALRYLLAKNPFPGVTGRVCPHFCQSNCNRAGYDACVNTRALERAVFDFASRDKAHFQRRPSTGKSVGIIGGGPAGLTAAYNDNVEKLSHTGSFRTGKKNRREGPSCFLPFTGWRRIF